MWAIYNPVKGWKLFNLSEAEAKKIVLTLSPNEQKLCYAAQKGDAAWVSLNEAAFVLDERLNSDQSGQGYPSIDAISSVASEDSGFFIFKPQKAFHARLHERLEVIVPLVFEGHNHSFETETVDLSEGGICVKDIIPEWVSGYFVVKVSTSDGAFQLICSLVEDQKIKQRIQIMSEESDPNYLKFKNWLQKLTHEKNQ